jgi:hypothetical protein
MRKTTRKKVQKEGRGKGIHVGEGPKWEGSMGKTTRQKDQKEGPKSRRNTHRIRT